MATANAQNVATAAQLAANAAAAKKARDEARKAAEARVARGPIGPVLHSKALVERIWKCALALGWRWPLFMPALQAIVFAEGDAACYSANVSISGRIQFNAEWAACLDDAELAGVVAHELSHLIYRHAERMEERQFKAWNAACDMALNQILVDASMKLPEPLLPEPLWHDWTAEQIYDNLPRQAGSEFGEDSDDAGEPSDGDGQGQGQGSGDGQGKPQQPGQGQGKPGQGKGKGQARALQGCGPNPRSEDEKQSADGDGKGDKDGDAANGNGQTQNEADTARWREVAAACEVMHNSSNRSDSGATAMSRLFNVPQPRVRWDKILRHGLQTALNNHGRDDQTWTRRSRRSTKQVYLPGWHALHAKVCVIVDNSGSVSDKDLSVAIYRVWEICRDVKGVNVFLVIHDHVVRFAGWINARTSVAKLQEVACRGRSGTNFDVAYKRVAEEKARFDWGVHLTDGECSWPNPTLPHNMRRLVVALVGTRCRQYIPEDARLRTMDARID